MTLAVCDEAGLPAAEAEIEEPAEPEEPEEEEPAEEEEAAPEPAVSIRSSVKKDYIICLEDGKKLKMLKRYLRTNYDMSPEEYRERWNLPSDYPMVAPNYAEKRRELAKKIGLGRAPGQKRGRRKKTAE